MSEDNKNPFGEKTVVMSSKDEPAPTPLSGEKTVVFAKSNLQETFDARTVVRSSKPVPAALPDEAPPKVIAADLPPPVSDADTNPDVRISSVASAGAEKPRLSKVERREARAALDRKTRKYMMAFGVICVFAIACGVVAVGGKSSDKPEATVATAESPALGKTDLASENEDGTATKNVQEAKMLGAYKTTTDVLKDFDRAAKKAQDHSVGF